jgi:hypothetical protein
MSDAHDDSGSGAGDRQPPTSVPDFVDLVEDLVDDVRRHANDRAIYRTLHQTRFHRTYWNEFVRRLAPYGTRVIEGLLCTGKIIRSCNERGHHVGHVPEWLRSGNQEAREVRKELAGETVANGLVIFRKDLEADRWRPDGGRSLASYFIGACLFAFPNVLRRWSSGETRWSRARDVLFADGMIRLEPELNPTSAIDAILTLEAMTAAEGNRVADVIRLHFYEFRSGEIAHILDLPVKSVRTIIREYQSRARSRFLGEGTINGPAN